MATRREILEELGANPVWRRRTPVVAGASLAGLANDAAAVAPADLPSVANPAIAAGSFPQPSPQAGFTEVGRLGPDERGERIARLEWGEFARAVDACNACGLCRTRQRAVPGVGDRKAHWMFVGEAPGAEEDARGEPFVGQAGRLLDSMLAALGMKRGSNVYIANVLKCRPPNNRTPEPAEAESCRPFLERQIALIQPKVIVALGRSAASLLLRTDATIASLRGRIHGYDSVPLVVTYHPAYLLRNLPDKAKSWEDLLLARQVVAREDVPTDPEPPSVAA